MGIITSPEQMEPTAEEQSAANDRAIAHENWGLYEYGCTRGHDDYCIHATRLERFYLGGGEQWDPDVKAEVEKTRLATEINEIMPGINTAVGYQIQNRVEFTFLPKSGEATTELAKVRSMVAKHILDANHYRWLETDVYEDGLIQQRGYFDIRVKFDDSMAAECVITIRDPKDVIPDPDGKTYEPDGWQYVITTYWWSLDRIEQEYGPEARARVEATLPNEEDWGEDSADRGRNKFGMNRIGGAQYNAWSTDRDPSLIRVRVIDRQHWRYALTEVAISKDTGDVRIIESMSPEQKEQIVADGNHIITRRKMRRVRWTVSTCDAVLFDDWSPFDRFTIIPYFPYFRRGKTRGMVDNAISPQETLNKAMSSYIHIVNSNANSGWVRGENTVVNMSDEDFRLNGAKTGLDIVVKEGVPKDRWPEKIQPAPIPAGIDRIIEHSRANLKSVLVNDELQGKTGEDMSGIAIQSRQFAAQMSLAKPLDNLARTRHMVAEFIDDIIGRFYDDPRVLRIDKPDPKTGRDNREEVAINQPNVDTGLIDNDLTVGEYDIAVAEVPVSVTFDNGQFQQMLELEKVRPGLIPPTQLIKKSTLTDKAEIIEAIDSQSDPAAAAEVEKIKAETKKLNAEAVLKGVEGIFSATETAQNIAALPEVAPLADDILGSAGFTDMDGPPIVPMLDQLPGGIAGNVPEPPRNTDPRFPANPPSPAVGMMAGIEGGQQ